MTSVQRTVWAIIENDAALRKNLLEGLINVSALARKLAHEHRLEDHVDAVISAIRRYEGSEERRTDVKRVYALLKAARLSTRTKLAAALLKKGEGARKRLGELYASLDFEGGDTLRVFEVTRYIKVVLDERSLDSVRRIFKAGEIVETHKRLGELSIVYDADITKVPGLFSTVSNELASNGISIVDSMICHSEHIIIVDEKDVEKTFNVVFGLTHR